ncbi:ATP-binding cassette sub-family C member 10-like [Ylistrum balloti]|uniref:ATP-binding cassette sub-family C member 10-like n=1 Tax=Ylistrum balloti TaxID=509963 RepID=UPI002905D79E|nr:ATP-binding cassette sub-family C member 10-like [Ylistrum balloti]
MEFSLTPQTAKNVNVSIYKDDNATFLQTVDYSVFHDFFTEHKFNGVDFTIISAFIVIITLSLLYRLKYSQGKHRNLFHEQKSQKETKEDCPSPDVPVNEDGVSLFSLLTFDWVRPLLNKGQTRRSLTSKDMFSLPKNLNVKKVHEQFLEVLQGNTTHPDGRKRVSLLKALHKAYGMDFYIRCGLLEFMLKLVAFTCPISLWMLISFFENDEGPSHFGYRYVFALFMSLFGIAFFDCIFECIKLHVYFKVRISVMTAIYEKILRLNTVSLSQFSTGQIVNFLGTDTDRIVAFCEFFHRIWIIPIEVVISMYILYQLVGIAFLGGVVIGLIHIPLNKIISTKQMVLSKTLMEQKDRRMKLMNEVLGGIKIIKFYTWEKHFRMVIDNLREAELQTMKQKQVLCAVIEYVWTLTPILMTLLTFSAYSMLGNTLTASKIFTCVAVFLKLMGSLDQLPMAFNGVIEAVISLERVEKFIALPEIDLNNYYVGTKETCESDNVISVNAGRFSWEKKACMNLSKDSRIQNAKTEEAITESGTLTLRNITLDISQGQFIGVIGKVGAGKSSFLHAVLAEMAREDGSISVSNLQQGFALASQEPWIQQTTIRDNVLFGNPFNGQKYAEILDAVSLRRDVQMLPAGDKTEVGENGVTLSGGQKARLALARAIYQNKDVYLLDDPLAAVDSHVARHIYDKCIMGLLRKKTRILCTHHTKFLWKADLIIVMDDGVISKMGVPSEILNEAEFAEHIPSSHKSETECDDNNDDNDYDGGLGEEVKVTGEIKSYVYKAFLAALGGWIPLAILLSVFFAEALEKIKGWFLTNWVPGLTLTENSTSVSGHLCFHDNTTSPNSLGPVYDVEKASGVASSQTSIFYYLTMYGCMAALYSFVTFAKEVLFAYGGIRLARTMHNQLLKTILKAPMSFFDVTPIGGILNRFSSDLGTIDDSLSSMINVVMCQLFGFIGTICIATYGMPWFLVILLPVSIIYYHIQDKYRHTSREVRRISTLKRSPIFSQFSETVSGMVTIRAFRETERFKDQHFECVDEWLKTYYTAHNVGNWLWVHTQMLVNVMVTGIATLAVLEHNIHGIDPSVVGMAISYVLSMSELMEGMVCCVTETEKQMVSVERVQQYIEDTTSERWEGTKPSPKWPALGVVSYSDVYMKYRDDLPNVLKGVSFRTRHAEKVGIVGRTGSGKSSLFQTLFRTAEINSGDITIDGVNIRQLDLKDVRRHLAVIPQDPFLFSGNVRENLDPTSCYSDEELWRVIVKCHLRHLVNRLGGLEGDVAEKGRNFSVGQRQLMCLARALLTKAKVLCIDEATASVDLDTDKLIQETIRQEFMDSTVLTIAHRINTIMDSDRVLVMDQGRVVELDSPGNLLKDTKSAFYQLVHGETHRNLESKNN